MSLLSVAPGVAIAEAAEATGVSAHTLRYYERAGLMLHTVERASTVAERHRLLVEHREIVRRRLDEVTLSLAAIDHKIDIYDKEIAS